MSGWCRIFGHKDDVQYRTKPRNHPARQGKGFQWTVRADAVYTCLRCHRVKVKP